MRNIRPKNGRELNAELTQLERQQRIASQSDAIFEYPRRLILRSPDGNHWQVTVDDAGALAAVSLGANPL
jgi:hypothetical protein